MQFYNTITPLDEKNNQMCREHQLRKMQGNAPLLASTFLIVS